MRPTESSLVAALRSPAGGAVGEVLAEAVTFRSPVADYRGRAEAARVLGALATVLEDLEPVRVLSDGDTTITFLTAAVDGHALDGVLDERRDEDGRVIDATLLLRPYAHVCLGIERMRALLGRQTER